MTHTRKALQRWDPEMSSRERARKAAEAADENRPSGHKWSSDVIADAASDVWEAEVQELHGIIVELALGIQPRNEELYRTIVENWLEEAKKSAVPWRDFREELEALGDDD